MDDLQGSEPVPDRWRVEGCERLSGIFPCPVLKD